MTLNNPKSGAGYVSEYQVSALPFVTASSAPNGSSVRVDFPYVTSFVQVRVTGSNVRVGFTNSGVLGGNYTTVTSTVPFDAKIRVKTLFITSPAGTSTFEVMAGLTLVDPLNFPILTGSAVPTAVSGTSYTGTFGYNGLG